MKNLDSQYTQSSIAISLQTDAVQNNLKKTYQSLSLIEQFINCADKLRDSLKTAQNFDSLKEENELILLELDGLIETLDNNNIPIDIIRNERLSLPKSKIERLGIGPIVIKQRAEQNLNYNQIAEYHNVSVGLISRFLNQYDRAKPSQQSKIKNSNSVFDTSARLEELNILIQSQLGRLDADPAIQVAYIRELRGLLQDASKITDKQIQLIEYKKFVTGVASVIEQIAPEKRELINNNIRSLVQDYQTITTQLSN
jgi:hypothetical protein